MRVNGRMRGRVSMLLMGAIWRCCNELVTKLRALSFFLYEQMCYSGSNVKALPAPCKDMCANADDGGHLKVHYNGLENKAVPGMKIHMCQCHWRSILFAGLTVVEKPRLPLTWADISPCCSWRPFGGLMPSWTKVGMSWCMCAGGMIRLAIRLFNVKEPHRSVLKGWRA